MSIEPIKQARPYEDLEIRRRPQSINDWSPPSFIVPVKVIVDGDSIIALTRTLSTDHGYHVSVPGLICDALTDLALMMYLEISFDPKGPKVRVCDIKPTVMEGHKNEATLGKFHGSTSGEVSRWDPA